MRLLILGFVFAVLPECAEPSISLDPARPYVEIVFERYGKRIPVFDGESDLGVWLRLRNNCILPVTVHVLRHENRNPGFLVPHTVTGGYSEFKIWDPLALKARIDKPIGYQEPDRVRHYDM